LPPGHLDLLSLGDRELTWIGAKASVQTGIGVAVWAAFPLK
jgi:hypothetical protein